MTDHAELQQRIRLLAPEHDARLFRNQVGTYELADGRWLSSGLVPGSADLIGWRSLVVTPDMVGRRLAVFAAVEVKTGRGALDTAQRDFLRALWDAGGLVGVARDEAEARAILDGL